MGLFDEWQAQKDSQYLLAVDYLEQLAKRHDSTIEATANYLIHCDSLKEIYEKSDNGEYYPAYEPTGYGYYDNDTSPPRIQFLESAKANTDTTGKILSKDFYRMWDNNYFKKSELPAIEPVAPSQPQKGEIKPQNAILQRDPFLTNLDIFTVIEASCLISGDDPIQIEICLGDTYFKQNNIDYLKAESFINAGIKSGNLDSDITRQSLQKFLLDKGYIIEGFNDTLPPATADKIGHATITQTMPTDSQLSQQVADLKAQLASAGNAIASQAERIAELERQIASIEQTAKPSNTPADKELNTKSQNTVAKILNAVLELADLNTNDPYSYDNPTSTNYFIYNQLVKNKMVVKPQTIGKWIELATQQTTDE